jgi:hypothetical protein
MWTILRTQTNSVELSTFITISNSDLSVVQPVASLYTDCAIPALRCSVPAWILTLTIFNFNNSLSSKLRRLENCLRERVLVCNGRVLPLHDGVSWSGGLVRDFFFTAYRPALGFTRPSLQWVQGDVSPEIKQLERDADHLPTSSAKVKKGICVCTYIYYTYRATR